MTSSEMTKKDDIFMFKEIDKILSSLEIDKEYNNTDYVNKIIKIQSVVRMYLENKKNIYICFRKECIKSNFEKVIKGYHKINEQHITNTVWEEIENQIVQDIYERKTKKYGNHISGKDNSFNNWVFSNKGHTIEENNDTGLSSYRLTKENQDEIKMKEEIKKRDLSFDYFSVLLRKDNKKEKIINYRWYIIPRNFHIFDVNKYPTYKKGKGWKSKYWEVKPSLSYQLWYKFKLDEIEKYLITDVYLDKSSFAKFTYRDIYNMNNNGSS